MDTIRTYLESMFSALPNTPEVRKAKSELWQMMEDKYNELIAEGRNENEAVGTVISEFGNLDDLAGELGIGGVVGKEVFTDGRTLGLDEVKAYLHDCSMEAFFHGLIAFLGIVCASGVIIAGIWEESFGTGASANMTVLKGLLFLFACIAGIIGLSVYSGIFMEKWKYLKRTAWSIDYSSARYVEERRSAERTTFALLRTVGILCCAMCFVPVVVISLISENEFAIGLGVVLLLFLVGTGVLILVCVGGREKAYERILRQNDTRTMSGHYVNAQGEVLYNNRTVRLVLSIYWPVVTCVYLIYSFLTFRWGTSWLIFVIAGVFSKVLESIWGVKPGD